MRRNQLPALRAQVPLRPAAAPLRPAALVASRLPPRGARDSAACRTRSWPRARQRKRASLVVDVGVQRVALARQRREASAQLGHYVAQHGQAAVGLGQLLGLLQPLGTALGAASARVTQSAACACTQTSAQSTAARVNAVLPGFAANVPLSPSAAL